MLTTLIILAGGKSQRMGKDKAFIRFHGETLVSRILDRLEGLAEEVIVIAPRSPENLPRGVQFAPDLLPGLGPLGGLYTALSVASHQIIAVVACDMPFVNAKLLAYQRDILLSEDLDVVVPSSEKGLEPLHAIYRKNSCLPRVRKTLEAGKGQLISWFPSVKVHILAPEESNTFDRRGLIFLNVNTPEELSKAENLELGNFV
ncbi:MAG: molybdenum cofactor guanylyltransferase [Anaerolineales bacterium]|jgi:molybdopterin-guanine dinucleotide biosynthesis protein A